MSGLSGLYEFLLENQVTQDNCIFVKQQIEKIAESEYQKGYMDCQLHQKKRRRLEEKRRKKFVKRFIDFLSDFTHSPKEKS